MDRGPGRVRYCASMEENMCVGSFRVIIWYNGRRFILDGDTVNTCRAAIGLTHILR